MLACRWFVRLFNVGHRRALLAFQFRADAFGVRPQRLAADRDASQLSQQDRRFANRAPIDAERRSAGDAEPQVGPRADDVEMEYPVEVTLPEAYKGAERVLELQGTGGRTRRLTVKIPAGVRDSQRIRLAGQAHAGSNGGPAGDLYLKVKVKPDPRFTRDGDDLRLDLPVALHEALLGAEVTVPTLKGRVSLRIPPETQNGRTIRLAGQGMPRAGGGSGDLYVTVKVVLPTKLNEKERELATELAAERRTEDVRSHLL